MDSDGEENVKSEDDDEIPKNDNVELEDGKGSVNQRIRVFTIPKPPILRRAPTGKEGEGVRPMRKSVQHAVRTMSSISPVILQ